MPKMQFSAEVTSEEWQLLTDTLETHRGGWGAGTTGRRYMIKDALEGRGWWRSHGYGYTTNKDEAGLFTAAELEGLALDDGQTIHAIELP